VAASDSAQISISSRASSIGGVATRGEPRNDKRWRANPTALGIRGTNPGQGHILMERWPGTPRSAGR
jgi:hypothetical protein